MMRSARIIIRLSALLVLSAYSHAKDTIAITTYPSVAYYNDKEIIDGPVVAVVKKAHHLIHQKVDFSVNPIQRMFIKLETHEADAAFNMSYNNERAKKWYYSKPLHKVHYALFTLATNPLNYKKRGDLKDYTLVTYGPTNMSRKLERFTEKIPGAKVVIENLYKTAFKKITVGRYEGNVAIYAPDTVAFDAIEKMGLQDKVRFAGNDIVNFYYMVFVKESVDKSYVDAFNKAIMEMHTSGEMKKIYTRYTGEIRANVPTAEEMKNNPPL